MGGLIYGNDDEYEYGKIIRTRIVKKLNDYFDYERKKASYILLNECEFHHYFRYMRRYGCGVIINDDGYYYIAGIKIIRTPDMVIGQIEII